MRPARAGGRTARSATFFGHSGDLGTVCPMCPMSAMVTCSRRRVLPSMTQAAVAVLLWLAVVPDSARAWTEARVTGVQAQVEVGRDGRFRVALVADLRVRHGWLSSFSIDGLGSPFALDPRKPPFLIGEDGRKYHPQVTELAGGGVELQWNSRRRAPTRGRYELGLYYETGPAEPPVAVPAGPHGGDRLQLAFQLPGWQVGLDRTDLYITGPSGTELVGVRAPGVDVATRQADPLVLLHVSRARLPRTTPWLLRLSVPRPWAAPELWPQRAPRLRSVSAETDPRPLLLWSLIVTLLCLVKQRWPAPPDAPFAFVIPLPAMLRTLLTVLFGALTCVQPAHPMAYACLAMAVLLSLVRPTPSQRPRCARFAPVSPLCLTVARQRLWASRFSGSAWLDLTRPAGFVLWVGLWLLAAATPAPVEARLLPTIAVALCTVLFLVGGAGRLAPGFDAALVALAPSLSVLRHAGLAPRLVQGLDARGRRRQARIALRPQAALGGLRRVDCLKHQVEWFEQGRRCWLLLVEVVAGSPADARARVLLPNATIAPLSSSEHEDAPARLVLAALCRDLPQEAAHVVAALGHVNAAPAVPSAQVNPDPTTATAA